MANRRLPVRKIKEILRLRYTCGLSKREIALSCNVARSTVADYLDGVAIGGYGLRCCFRVGERDATLPTVKVEQKLRVSIRSESGSRGIEICGVAGAVADP